MLKAQSDTQEKSIEKSLIKMKGQAVPLFSYHIIRDHVLSLITDEYQSSILYWAGKDLAHEFTISTFQDCVDLFLELGWGSLEVEQSNHYMKSLRLSSPFFNPRKVTENDATFALECGFLTEALASTEQKETEGNFKVISKAQETYVQFTIYLQEKKGTISS